MMVSIHRNFDKHSVCKHEVSWWKERDASVGSPPRVKQSHLKARNAFTGSTNLLFERSSAV
jgi:hypothetical protein